jgi:hypothetical protein
MPHHCGVDDQVVERSITKLLLPCPGLDALKRLSFLVFGTFGMVETLQPAALGLIVLWPSLATVVVALRVYTRISMKRVFLGKGFPTTKTRKW